MTLLEIAQIYTDLVNADSEIPDGEYRAKDLISALRTKYHNMLMEQMQALFMLCMIETMIDFR